MKSLRELQLIELEVLQKIADICGKENLTYYINYGTLLGAVRHNGYIPWDDDTDISMPRPDYDRFMQVAGKYLGSDMYLEDFKTTEDYRHYPARLSSRDGKLRVHTVKTEFEQSVCVDIFPLDGMPNGKVCGALYKARLFLLRSLYMFSVFDLITEGRKDRAWYEKMAVSLGNVIPIQKLFDVRNRLAAINRAISKYPYENAKYIANLMGAYKMREIFDKDMFRDGKVYLFEGRYFVGPADHERYLTYLYGNYMEPPPEKDRNKHGTAPAGT